jgi:thymidylate synthase
MANSRKQFETEMTKRYKSIHELFKVFERDSKGNYVREEMQSIWTGWKMHEEHSAQGKRDVE